MFRAVQAHFFVVYGSKLKEVSGEYELNAAEGELWATAQQPNVNVEPVEQDSLCRRRQFCLVGVQRILNGVNGVNE